MKLYNKIVILLIIGLLIGTGFLPHIAGHVDVTTNRIMELDINNNYCLNYNQNDAELPTWQIGDSWIYNIEIDGSHGSDAHYDISINNLKIKH